MSDIPSVPANRAVFVSYASEDAEAAKRLSEALGSAGIQVWFDQEELVGGNSWDSKIRKQISDCSLFLPIISATTQSRDEGYFRLEWKLAVDRSHLMAHDKTFLLPVVIDATSEATARVPQEFRAVQWTRLNQGEVTPAFVARVKRLMNADGAAPTGSNRSTHAAIATAPGPRPPNARWVAAALGFVVVTLASFVALRSSSKNSLPQTVPGSVKAEPTTHSPEQRPLSPEKSIAVLPFENLSPDKDNAFFADGVQMDVITSLTKIRDLKVIGRSSVLSYRDPATRNHRKIGADLGVATLLEGTVRRAGTKVRVTAQLINAQTDESIWAETYDVDLTDAFTIQSALAQNISAALKANFTPDERAYVAQLPTQNQDAYDLYLRGRTLFEASGLSSARTDGRSRKFFRTGSC